MPHTIDDRTFFPRVRKRNFGVFYTREIVTRQYQIDASRVVILQACSKAFTDVIRRSSAADTDDGIAQTAQFVERLIDIDEVLKRLRLKLSRNSLKKLEPALS